MSIEQVKAPVGIDHVQFVIGAAGKPTAVPVDIATWERIIQALEDAEDLAIVKQALVALDAAGGDPEKAGFLPWERVRAELETDQPQK
jgi:hypothetical protein